MAFQELSKDYLSILMTLLFQKFFTISKSLSCFSCYTFSKWRTICKYYSFTPLLIISSNCYICTNKYVCITIMTLIWRFKFNATTIIYLSVFLFIIYLDHQEFSCFNLSSSIISCLSSRAINVSVIISSFLVSGSFFGKVFENLKLSNQTTSCFCRFLNRSFEAV